jgi:hypothetical protein
MTITLFGAVGTMISFFTISLGMPLFPTEILVSYSLGDNLSRVLDEIDCSPMGYLRLL